MPVARSPSLRRVNQFGEKSRVKRLTPISATLERLATGGTTSLSLVNECLDAIAAPDGEGQRAFTRVAPDAVRAAALQVDAAVGKKSAPLAGLPISIKDLFDVAGEPTPAGSVVLANSAPKISDAVIVKHLRSAGAVIMGRTNMTEFAYSGLGINPHYGTPRNPYDRATGRIPGGSSSGAVVSVSDGMAHAAIGSDTGGSVRIPAALCGVVGFKPTARRVPMSGVLPLSPSLDSIGPIAPTVACCALLDSVLSGEAPQPVIASDLSSLHLAVLQGYVLDDLQSPVSDAFTATLALLSSRGARLTDVHFASLNRIPEVNAKGGLIAAESYAWHRHLLENHSAEYDPRVLSRIMRGSQQSAADYIDLLHARQQITADAALTFAEFDAILLPTLPCIAPPIAELAANNQAYLDANAAMLRNPSIFNFLDGCALSVPCHLPGEAPVGLMIAGLAGQDKKILSIGAAIELALAVAGRAVNHIASTAVVCIAGLLMHSAFTPIALGQQNPQQGGPQIENQGSLSVRVADAAMARWPDGHIGPKDTSVSWGFEPGIVLAGFSATLGATSDKRYLNYIQHAVDQFVTPDGLIRTYDLHAYSLNNILIGRQLLLLYKATKEEKYRRAADTLYQQLLTQPRTLSGGYWHELFTPNLLLVDDEYMFAPFLAEYATTFHQSNGVAAKDLAEVAAQFKLLDQYARDPKTGLLYHGWDESRTQPWVDKSTGDSETIWARGMGWYLMALVDTLPYYPQNDPNRAALLDNLQRTAAALIRAQDLASGLWYQVLDKPGLPGNYMESSSAMMFIYALAKGVRLGYLPSHYRANVERAWGAIVDRFVRVSSSGEVTITGTVTHISPGATPKDDGTYNYYLHAPVVSDDPKGVGAFLLAAAEMIAGKHPGPHPL
jgi:aspartyl-tRNA(Asn)/glutamyl-tRNA(Gln) amidotransferase subunit A